MKKVLAALCMIVLFCIVFLSISGCTEEEKTEEANQSNYGKQQCFEHNFGMYLVEIAPTCTEKGIESAYCAVCGEKSVREIQPLGHDLEGLPCEGRHCSRCEYTEAPTAHVYELIEEIPADCLYAGIKIYSCECGESYTEEVPASGHSFGEWQVSTPSTCIKEGVEKRVCERCLAEETRSLSLAEHDFGEWTATVSPTCTEPGSKNRACSVCGHTETAEIPAVGHKYVLVEERSATCVENGKKIFECSVCHDIKEEITEDKLNHDFGDAAPCAEDATCIRCGKERLPLPHSHATREIEPTCTESGYIEEYCTECGKIFAKIEKAEPSGHDFCEWRLVKAPTCTEPGVQTRVCERCGERVTETVEATGHSVVYVPAKAADCTQDGYEAYAYCSECGEEIIPKVAIAAAGHDFGEWETETAATCEEEGTEARSCKSCGTVEKRVVPATGHSVVDVSAKAADCTHDGYEAYAYCSECGEEIIPKVAIAAAGHDFGGWEQAVAPTCTAPGARTKVCTRCGERVTETVEATGHSVVDVSAKAADCTQDGYGAYAYCSECGEEIIPKVTVAALGHDFGEWETDIAATCVAEGVEKRVCSRCGAEETCNTAVAEHNFSEWVITRAPTCTEPGVQTRVCASCGISETSAIPVTEHEWEEVFVLPATETSEGKTIYKCSICHAEKEETIPKIEHVHDYDYVSIYGVGVACSCGRVIANEGNVIIDSSNTVSGICEGSGNIIVVPNSAYDVDWRTVFYMNDEIEYIYFGENITLIADPCAFEGCENLKAIYVSTECYIPDVPEFWPDMEIIRVDYNS